MLHLYSNTCIMKYTQKVCVVSVTVDVQTTFSLLKKPFKDLWHRNVKSEQQEHVGGASGITHPPGQLHGYQQGSVQHLEPDQVLPRQLSHTNATSSTSSSVLTDRCASVSLNSEGGPAVWDHCAPHSGPRRRWADNKAPLLYHVILLITYELVGQQLMCRLSKPKCTESDIRRQWSSNWDRRITMTRQLKHYMWAVTDDHLKARLC